MSITEIEKDFCFQTAVHFSDTFYLNNYNMTVFMTVETSSMYEQNIAMERITYFLNETLQNSILIDTIETNAISKYIEAGIKACELPEEPYDQILNMVLLMKLNAIVEGRLIVTRIILGSLMSDDVRNSMQYDVAEKILAGNFWWNKSSLSLAKQETTNTSNVVNLFDKQEWTQLGLNWKEKTSN